MTSKIFELVIFADVEHLQGVVVLEDQSINKCVLRIPLLGSCDRSRLLETSSLLGVSKCEQEQMETGSDGQDCENKEPTNAHVLAS